MKLISLIFVLFLLVGCGDDKKTVDDDQQSDSSTVSDSENTDDSDTDNEQSDSDETVAVILSGSVEKGPFVLGSSITISPVDIDGNPTGQQFTTQTINDLGEFEVNFDASGFVSLEGTGFYFNEVEGEISSSNLTLRAFYEIKSSGKQDAHLNLLTHLIYNRVKTLIQDGKTMDEAVAQAEEEIVAALPIGPEDFKLSGNTTDLTLQGGDNDDNAYLFAVSSVIIHTAFHVDFSGEGGVQELINKISLDLADDGELKTDLVDKLENALTVPEYFNDESNLLITENIEQNLADRFETLESDAVVPDLDKILDQDGDGIVNADDNCWTIANPGQDASKCAVTWIDPDTGLMWHNPIPEYPLEEKQVEDMFDYCENLELGGYDDWYVPSINDLRSIVDGCEALETGGACNIVDDTCVIQDCYSDGCNPDSCGEGGGPQNGYYLKSGLRGGSSVSSTFITRDGEDSMYMDWMLRWMIDPWTPKLIRWEGGREPVRCVRGGTPMNGLCPEGYTFNEGQCDKDSGDTGNTGDTGDTGDTGNTGDTGDSGLPTVSPVIDGANVTFFYIPPPGGNIKVVGDFTTPAWDISGGIPMQLDGTSSFFYATTGGLTCGQHAYKFVIDDTTWVKDALNPDDDGEPYYNSVFTLEGGGCIPE